ncbi:response regulator [Undibacterium amnicola]|uniref:histidine kinase n=1 Tax=Undibacterium amnicola TaxID=1834038 RepID=A0ABR6XND1_9BURK|nr:hybrid sensor histidine kinase/response regulator [Undibacterium amnicola]MBC3831015.1 response regulator [Undibacterium amnicola]
MKPSSLKPDHDQEFLNLRIRLLSQQAIRVPVVLLVISLIVCFALKDAVSLERLLLWILIFQCTAIPRAIFAYWVLYRRKNSRSAIRDYWIFILFAGLTGLSAGLSAPLFFPTLSPAEQAFIGMVLTGLVAGGVATSGSSPLVLAAYALAALLPLGFAWNIYGNDRSHLVTWLVLLFSTIMVAYARDGKKVLYESFLIRRQRDEAINLLQQKNEEIIQAKATMENLAQTKNRVLAAASHDLRQPLHALSIYSAVLSANPSTATLKEIGQNINQLVGSLAALLDAMLDLSQLDSNSFPTQNNQTCLAKISRKIASEFEHSITSKGLRLEASLLDAPVHSDPLILERMIRNLVDNAVKYTSHGYIRIRTEVGEGKSIFSVEDSGKGIANHQLGKIFEEFYQIDNPGRDRRQGLGLGLSIVQRMGNLIQTELNLESKLDVGTTVTLKLPYFVANQHDVLQENVRANLLGGTTILLIDDEYSIIASMSALLQMWGAKSLSATDRSSALKAIQSNHRIDFIIADLRLKNGENGIAVVREIQHEFTAIPALIISGETSPERLSEAKNSGYPVLQKPVTADQLYATLLDQLHLK